MEGPRLQQLFSEHADAARVLDRSEGEESAKLCEIAKHLLKSRAKQFVYDAQGRPLLYSYQGDSTPLLAQATHVDRRPNGQHIVRKAGRATELLLQRVFLKTISLAGEHLVTCFFRDPVPLDNGKGTWPCFTAACDCFPMLQHLGHKGIAISHFCFDRALFSSLERVMRQRHMLYHDIAIAGASNEGQEALGEMTDWVVSTACSNHDAQNALKWGLAWLQSGDDTTKKLHIAIESLRNAYDLLQKYILTFLVQFLELTDHDFEIASSMEAYWICLGVDTDVAQELSELGARWHSGKLLVFRTAATSDDFMDKVRACLLSVFRFKKFTDSRWITVGEACRGLVASLSLGLSGLVGLVRKDPKASDYYIGGSAGLDGAVLNYAIVASVVTNACDSFLLALLEDDRVARRLSELEGILQEELMWVVSISDGIWGRLAELTTGVSPCELRSWALRAASIIQAFITHKVIRVARGLPWSLVQGDIVANLQTLAEKEGPLDSTSTKIRSLVRSGYPMHRIVAGVQLLGEVHWTSTSVEQGHCSTSTLHRLLKQYGANMLCQRSMLHMLRLLMPCTDPEDKVALESARREAILKRQKPQYCGGRQVFVAELCQAFAEQEGRKASKEELVALFRQHASMFALLSKEDQQHYHVKASIRRSEAEEKVQGELQLLWADNDLRQKRLRLEQAAAGSMLRMSHCRLQASDFDMMAAMYSSSDFAAGQIQVLRQQAMLSPKAPSPSVAQRLGSFHITQELAEDEIPRPWISSVCRLRDSFRDCILWFVDSDGSERDYLFIYATQNPMHAEFAPLQRIDLPHPCVSTGTQILAALDQHFDHSYTMQWGMPMCAKQIAFDVTTKIFVLPQVGFIQGNTLASHSEPIPLLEFVKSLMQGGVKPAPKASSSGAPKLEASLLEEFPWLSAYVADGYVRSGGSGSSGQGGQVGPREVTMDDEAIDKAFEILNSKRQGMAVHEELMVEGFKISLLGGAWTQQHKGVACDAVKAYASGKAAKAWCATYALPKDATFAIRKYGEHEAHALALEWCRRLEYFHSIFCKQNSDAYEYTAVQIDVCSPPVFLEQGKGVSSQVSTRLGAISSMVPKKPVACTRASSSGLVR